jgi:hypothetical protein
VQTGGIRTDSPTRGMDEQDDIDEQELKRRYYECLSDWSEPNGVKINRGGKLVKPLAELPKQIFKLPWNRPRR